MASLGVSFPLAIGEQIYARAALDAVKQNYGEIRVGLNWQGLDMRPPGYRPFAVAFGQMLWSDGPYCFDEHAADLPYTPYEKLYVQGYQPQLPWFPEVLCDPGAPLPEKPYVTLSTKVRFWGRSHFEEIRGRFFSELRAVADRYRIALLGERDVPRVGETACWGPETIYSIYPDIMQEQLPVADHTFAAFAGDDFRLDRLRRDCTIMHHAIYNINLGVGGSVALGLAVGKVVALHGCGAFPHINALFAQANNERVLVTGDPNAYYDRLQAL